MVIFKNFFLFLTLTLLALAATSMGSLNPCLSFARTRFIAASASFKQLCGSPSCRTEYPKTDYRRIKNKNIAHHEVSLKNKAIKNKRFIIHQQAASAFSKKLR
jgi:hypothetical protein